MDGVRKSRCAPQSFPDSPACVVRSVSKGQILRSGKEGSLELDCRQTVPDGWINHELAGDGHPDRGPFHPHRGGDHAAEPKDLSSIFTINERRKIRVVPWVFEKDFPKVGLEFIRRDGIVRKNS